MKLFTYGTLNGHQSMRNAKPLGEAFTVNEYYKGKQSFYPYLLQENEVNKNVNVIQGYLWEVPEKDFKEIDQYEGAPLLFYRTEITVKTGDEEVQALCYFIVPSMIW